MNSTYWVHGLPFAVLTDTADEDGLMTTQGDASDETETTAGTTSPTVDPQAAQTPGTLEQLLSMAMLIVPMGLLVYFMMIRPEKKRKKQRAELLNELIVGDEITTNGGIVGRVIQIKDDAVIMETGNDKVRIKIMRWAIASKSTPISDK